MATYIMLIKMAPGLAKNFSSIGETTKQVGAKYKAACPDVKVTAHLALLGPYDFMDIIEAPNEDTVFRMGAAIMSSGLAESIETWSALSYQKLLELTKDL